MNPGRDARTTPTGSREPGDSSLCRRHGRGRAVPGLRGRAPRHAVRGPVERRGARPPWFRVSDSRTALAYPNLSVPGCPKVLGPLALVEATGTTPRGPSDVRWSGGPASPRTSEGCT